jgi:hypothetical protein
MTNEMTTVISPALQQFCFDMQDLIFEGWEIDPNNPPVMWGIVYEAGMIRNEQTAHKYIGLPEKIYTEDRMAKARMAKAAKREDNANT